MIKSRTLSISLIPSILIGFLFVSSIQGQAPAGGATTTPAKTTTTESSDAPEEVKWDQSNYYMKQDPYRYATSFHRQSKENLLKLKRLIDLYDSRIDWAKSSYDNIRSSYRKGMSFYYMGNYESSIPHLNNSMQAAQDLMKKFADYYKNEATLILQNCSESMVERDLAMLYEDEKNMGSEKVMKNQFKLRIAYNQMASGDSNIDAKRYEQAIEHYRLAKLHGINVLINLADTPAKKKELSEKYKIDLQDAYGLAPETNTTAK